MPRVAARLGRLARRHPWRAGIAILLLAIVLGTLVDLLRIRADVEAGRRTLTSLSAQQLNRDLLPTVRDAVQRLDDADAVADRSPFLSLVGALPVVGEQVDGLRTLTEAANDLGSTALRATEAVDPDLRAATKEPAARLRLLDALLVELDRVEADAARIDLGPPLVGPLGGARAALVRELDGLPDRLGDARARLRVVRRVLDGPTRYLVLAANNAEMRGGAGMPLSGGVLTIEGGDLAFGDFESVANRWAGPIPEGLVPAEYGQTYRQFRMGQSWLQTAVSPNFERTGPVFDAMASAFPQVGPVEGVLVVDVVTLRYMLETIGPVEVGGVRYTAENVEQKLLNENYLAFGAEQGAQTERREAQGAVASAVFDALTERDADLGSLTDALERAALGRHLLAWTEDDGVQEIFEELGATGTLHPAGLMVTVQNISADKLDWYIDPSVVLRSELTTDRSAWSVRLTVRVPNPERTGDTSGVETYREDYRREQPEGIHRALVAVYLPEAAFDIRPVGGAASEAGADPPLWMVGQRVFIEEGEEARVSVDFKVPAPHVGLVLLPSARVRPVSVEVNGLATDDAVPRVLLLEVPPSEARAGTPLVATAGVALVGVVALSVLAWRRGLRPSVRPR